MKIHIFYNVKSGPWGGANQFLRSLGKELNANNLLADSVEDATHVLFNLNPTALKDSFDDILALKKKFHSKVIVARIDGPITYIRGCSLAIDRAFYFFCRYFADLVVFQTEWSKEKSISLDKRLSSLTSNIIINATDKNIFNSDSKKQFNAEKVSLIATSWSDNMNKGFAVYKWLDDNLDFSRFTMTFVGNSPIEFNNIVHIKPLASKELAAKIKEHNIFITASINDPCSNSLIEAMACGLPALVINSGGHPEIVDDAGIVFDNTGDLLEKLDVLVKDYDLYSMNNEARYMDKAVDAYRSFFNKKNVGRDYPSFAQIAKIKFYLKLYELEDKMRYFCNKFKNNKYKVLKCV